MNKHITLAIIPLIALLFFTYAVHEMMQAEKNLVTLYAAHTDFIEQAAANPDQKENLTSAFAQKIALSKSEENRIKRSTTLQRAIDTLTFSQPHCLAQPKSTNCLVYSEDLILEANRRHNRLFLQTGTEPQRENILSARAYTAKDYGRAAVILLLETLAISASILWVLTKR